MRIIGGKIGGIRLHPPKNLPVRPTTDIAKEALFNILQNELEFDQIEALDLFAGTGNISFELASRGAQHVLSVDIHHKCLKYVEQTAVDLKLSNIKTRRADVFKYLKTAEGKFDFIFADPPYDIDQLPHLAHLVFERDLLNKGGLLVIEHPTTRHMEKHPMMSDERKYGYSSFAFYHNPS